MKFFGTFPRLRLRRNRKADWSRRLVTENSLSANDLVLPLFVHEGQNRSEQIKSMPDIKRFSIDLLIGEIRKAEQLGIPAIAVFPVVDSNIKTDMAEESYNADNLVCRAISEIKGKNINIGIICDVALDPYTSHGHDGILKEGVIQNDRTVDILCKQAVAQARAGCDIVAPSDMMDGRVGKIRDALDSEGFQDVQILSYAAKYASNFYGPFRDAVGSSENLAEKDKKTYQMDPANSNEAIREVALDINEGADMIMIKPGLPYLDIIKRVKDEFNIPTFAYQVSGEYAMIKAADENGWINGQGVILESLLSFKRAGATGVFTYAAIEVAEKMQ